jgi:type IV pilus assembly protein PilZ
MIMPQSEHPEEKRSAERYETGWEVDCETEDTFLFAPITNISAMGIFVRTDKPLAVGTIVKLSFAPTDMKPFFMQGQVRWVNRVQVFGDNINPGMGIMFVDLGRDDRERLVAAIRSIAYLRRDPLSDSN